MHVSQQFLLGNQLHQENSREHAIESNVFPSGDSPLIEQNGDVLDTQFSYSVGLYTVELQKLLAQSFFVLKMKILRTERDQMSKVLKRD